MTVRFQSLVKFETYRDEKRRRRKSKIQFIIQFKFKVIKSYLAKQNPYILPEHKSYKCFQDLTGIDRGILKDIRIQKNIKYEYSHLSQFKTELT